MKQKVFLPCAVAPLLHMHTAPSAVLVTSAGAAALPEASNSKNSLPPPPSRLPNQLYLCFVKFQNAIRYKGYFPPTVTADPTGLPTPPTHCSTPEQPSPTQAAAPGLCRAVNPLAPSVPTKGREGQAYFGSMKLN